MLTKILLHCYYTTQRGWPTSRLGFKIPWWMELVEKVHVVSGYIFLQYAYQLYSERSFMVNKHVLESLQELCFVALNVVSDSVSWISSLADHWNCPIVSCLIFFQSCKRFINLPGILHTACRIDCSHKNCCKVLWLCYASVSWLKCSKFINLKCVNLNRSSHVILHCMICKQRKYDSHKNWDVYL